jgi:type I restriction enzyme S subunit
LTAKRPRNHNLEEQAQALYKSWFVDFEPFKDCKFVDSEMGKIPEGWKVLRFEEFIGLSNERVNSEMIPEFSVTNNGIFPRDVKFNKQLSSSSLKNKVIRKGNLVFGMSREILNWGIMKEPIGGVSSAYTVYVINETLVSPQYMEYFIKNHVSYFKDLIKPAAREGQGIDRTILLSKRIVLPNIEVWERFRLLFDVLLKGMLHSSQELLDLTNYRDELLPALVNGHITC